MRSERPPMSAAPAMGTRSASHPFADTETDLHRTLLDVLRSISSHRDLASLLRELAGLLRSVAHSDRLVLVLHDPARDVMRLHTIAGTDIPRTTVTEMPIAETLSGMVWETQRAVIV